MCALCPVYWYDIVGQKAQINMVIIRLHASVYPPLEKLQLIKCDRLNFIHGSFLWLCIFAKGEIAAKMANSHHVTDYVSLSVSFCSREPCRR